MNNRVKELAEQASHQSSDGYPVTIPYSKDFAEKFAELLIAECLLCCERTISDPVSKEIDSFEQGGIHCMNEIKYIFGVEE